MVFGEEGCSIMSQIVPFFFFFLLLKEDYEIKILQTRLSQIVPLNMRVTFSEKRAIGWL